MSYLHAAEQQQKRKAFLMRIAERLDMDMDKLAKACPFENRHLEGVLNDVVASADHALVREAYFGSKKGKTDPDGEFGWLHEVIELNRNKMDARILVPVMREFNKVLEGGRIDDIQPLDLPKESLYLDRGKAGTIVYEGEKLFSLDSHEIDISDPFGARTEGNGLPLIPDGGFSERVKPANRRNASSAGKGPS